MRAGQLKYTITLLTNNPTTDNFGSQSENWITYSIVRAGLVYKSGQKLIQDYEMFNSATIDFTCRYDKFINEAMRIKFNDKIYKILFLNKNIYDNSLIISTELIVGVNDSYPVIGNTGLTMGELIYQYGPAGSSGTSGINGSNGSSGTSGIGISGSSGTSGINGSNGSSGTSGSSGSSGISQENYIKTTRVNLYDNLIFNNLLMPEQVYLITDYRTESPIRSAYDANEIYTAPIEQIYVKALTTNTLSSESESKDYTEETLTFLQDVSPLVRYMTSYYENGYDSGPYYMTNIFTEGFTIDLSGVSTTGMMNLSSNGWDYVNNTNYDILGINGDYKYTTSFSYDCLNNDPGQNNNDYMNSFNMITIIDPTAPQFQIDLVDLTFSNYIFDNSFNISISTPDGDWVFYESDIDVNISITDEGLVTYIGSDIIDLTTSIIYGSWNTNADTYELSLNTTDRFTLTLLHRNNFDFTNCENSDGYIQTVFDYISKSFYGKIIGRHNWEKDLIIDCDYRGTKFRRYSLYSTLWDNTTSYSKSQIINIYNGEYTYYIAVADNTNISPLNGDPFNCWAKIGLMGNYDYPVNDIQIGYQLSISPDLDNYHDMDMFPTLTNDGLYGVHIFDTLHTNLVDVVFRNQVYNSTLEMMASLTVLNNMANTKLKLNEASIIHSITGSEGTLQGGYILSLDTSNFSKIYQSYIFSFSVQDFGILKRSMFLGYSENNRIEKIEDSLFYSTVNNNDIKYMSYCTVHPTFQYNSVENMSAVNINTSGSFNGNLLYGNFNATNVYNTFNSNVCFGAIGYCNFSGSTYTNIFYSSSYFNNFNCQLQGNTFQNGAQHWDISNPASNIYNNTFGGSTGYNTLSGEVQITANNVSGQFSYITGTGNAQIAGNYFASFTSNIITNITSLTYINYNTFHGTCHYNSFSDTTFQNNIMIADFNYNELKPKIAGQLVTMNYNIFKGNTNYNNFWGQQFNNNEIGSNFLGNTAVSSTSTSYSIIPANTSSLTFGSLTTSGTYLTNKNFFKGYTGFGDTNFNTTSSTVHNYGSVGHKYVSKITNYDLTDSDYIVEYVTGTTTATVRLPIADNLTGRVYIIKNNSTGVVTVDGYGTNTIDGQLTKVLYQNQYIKLINNGLNWITIGGNVGNQTLNYVFTGSTYNIKDSDNVIDCSGTYSIYLPTAVGITGRVYIIKNSGSGTVTIDANGSETIDGSLTTPLTASQKKTLISTGSNWIIC